MYDSKKQIYQTRIFVTVLIECYLAGKSLGVKLLRKYCCRCEDVIKLELRDRGCEDFSCILLCIVPCRGALLATVTGKNTECLDHWHR
jgi:hypothetical protein